MDNKEEVLKIEVREYKDALGDDIVEYSCKNMRLRTCIKHGVKLFNESDIYTLQGYDAEEVFNFLSEAMGDELFNYLADEKEA
jgi:hypothetical protein